MHSLEVVESSAKLSNSLTTTPSASSNAGFTSSFSAETSGSDANIHTFLRIRPTKNKSLLGYFKIDELSDNALHFYLPENYKPPSDYVNNTKTHYK